MKLKSILLLLGFVTSTLVQAGGWPETTAEQREVALTYNHLLNIQQVEQAMALVDENVRFSDPTWGVHNQNKTHLATAYSSMSGSYHNMQFDIRKVSSSKGTLVIHMIGSADVDLSPDASADQRVHLFADFIRVLEVKDGKIVRHLDLSDYDKFMPSLMPSTGDSSGQ
ncbi:nuclear transport factor 2 family protein [Aliiglaciecola sp. CAU 1673]|uniref:nuclear transport factor 2 family protein n=1 Tax=Aliiglaciecola sp. CAU 1673 TaxID=3032595 RepID=UPI0023D9CF3F|nr:nuclear transport factor 2 family protein [Aliiglaciecola sp. CAU 1673]MDF2179372.1 nuclear transport factor 2 family protein [Aliiglaciecola sp. CAU 1673]